MRTRGCRRAPASTGLGISPQATHPVRAQGLLSAEARVLVPETLLCPPWGARVGQGHPTGRPLAVVSCHPQAQGEVGPGLCHLLPGLESLLERAAGPGSPRETWAGLATCAALSLPVPAAPGLARDSEPAPSWGQAARGLPELCLSLCSAAPWSGPPRTRTAPGTAKLASELSGGARGPRTALSTPRG